MNRGARRLLGFLLAVCATASLHIAGAQEAADPILRAMREEIERSRQLSIVNLDSPYYIEYSLDDLDSFSASASLGGLIGSRHTRVRLPRVQVRVGSYDFDNTNYIFTDLFGRVGSAGFPLENDLLAMRTFFWLATDQAYKGAVQAIARKRAALQHVTESEVLADLAKAQPTQKILPIRRYRVNQQEWNVRVRQLSAIFAGYPAIIESDVEFQAGQSTAYYANSEGTQYRIPENLSFLRVRGAALAPDGMLVRNGAVICVRDVSDLPSEAELRQRITTLAENLSDIVKAPAGESYIGPVLLEGEAAPQMFAQLLGDNLAMIRRPVSEPNRPIPLGQIEFEGRINSRVLPEWIDVVDDPTQSQWRGRPLLGYYPVDMEGVPPVPLTIIEKGTLKNVLLTRQPVRGYSGSNGRARLPGNFGAKGATFGNLFIKASQTASVEELKRKLIEICRERNKPHGLLVRKLDYPSTAPLNEIRRMAAGMAQASGGRNPVSLPVLVYRVYADGREELVRGMRFRNLSVRSLRDIVAVSSENHVFDFLDNTAPFAATGGATFVAPATVVAPSVLFDELELERSQEQLPKLPLVPPPSLSEGAAASGTARAHL